MPSRVTRETLRRMIDEFDLIPMSDGELDQVVPLVQSLADAVRRTNEVDLTDVRSSHIFHASLSGIQRVVDTGQPRLG